MLGTSSNEVIEKTKESVASKKEQSVSIQTPSQSAFSLHQSLSQIDPLIASLIQKEAQRQHDGLELIASENFTSLSVLQANSSILTNKYSEGYPGARYYGGNQIIDQIENICQERALQVFRLNPMEWGVNVQPYSGSPANFAVYTGVLQPHDRIMGLDLPSGGHLTHGYMTAKKRVSASSVYFESMPYRVNPVTGFVDYDELARTARLFHPKLIICGGSAYPREWDYARLRQIADEQGSLLMCDMAHIAGLIAGGQMASPFDYCDIVTTTTHKTLRGPRAGMIFYRKKGGFDSNKENIKKPGTGTLIDLETKINQAVFPGCQGGPHNHTIAAIAVALAQASTPQFREYAARVISNARALCTALQSLGHSIATGGTDNHIILWDLRPHKLNGSRLERICELVKYFKSKKLRFYVFQFSISVNKNSVPGDTSAFNPGGVRLGTPAVTTRGMNAEHMSTIASLLHQAFQIALDLNCQQQQHQVEDSKPFSSAALLNQFTDMAERDERVKDLAEKVKFFASTFSMPGYAESFHL